MQAAHRPFPSLDITQSLHASDSKATGTAVAELREMLKEASSPQERAVVQKELAAAERGKAGEQRSRVKYRSTGS